MELEKALEEALSEVLSREDTWLLQIQKRIKYLCFVLFKKIKYRDYQLHGNKLLVSIPDFFKLLLPTLKYRIAG